MWCYIRSCYSSCPNLPTMFHLTVNTEVLKWPAEPFKWLWNELHYVPWISHPSDLLSYYSLPRWLCFSPMDFTAVLQTHQAHCHPKTSTFYHFSAQMLYYNLPSHRLTHPSALPGGLDGKESTCNAGNPSLIPGLGRSLEKGMATHSSILAWRIPWTEEPDGLQSMGSQRVRHDWKTNTSFSSL